MPKTTNCLPALSLVDNRVKPVKSLSSRSLALAQLVLQLRQRQATGAQGPGVIRTNKPVSPSLGAQMP
jgi:hypothetical protein